MSEDRPVRLTVTEASLLQVAAQAYLQVTRTHQAGVGFAAMEAAIGEVRSQIEIVRGSLPMVACSSCGVRMERRAALINSASEVLCRTCGLKPRRPLRSSDR